MKNSEHFLNLLDWTLLVALPAILLAHLLKLIPVQFDNFILISAAVIASLPVVASALQALAARKVTVDLLASVALIVSLIAREWASGVFINLMLVSARIFSRYTEGRTSRAIESLLKLRPVQARVKRGENFVEVPLEEVKKGDIVMVKLGERIPVDGIIIEGVSGIDQSSLTGESLPVDKEAGDQVLSSTIVVSGALIIRAEKVGKETAFEKIIELVTKSQENKSPISSFGERFAGWYISIAFAGAILLWFLSHDLNIVLSILLVVCADDIAIAIPLAFTAAIGRAAKSGVIIKGGNFLEGLSKVKVVIVDKTGTLTFGKLKVDSLVPFDNQKMDEILSLAGAITSLSSHPTSRAITQFVKEKKISFGPLTNFEEIGGRGAKANFNGQKIVIGRAAFFEEEKIKIDDAAAQKINEYKEKGFNTTLLGADGKLIGFFALADELKPNIKDAISELQAMGVEQVVMLTGDNEKVAKRIAETVGIKEFYANLLPEEKIEYLKKYLGAGRRVVMIGDGVNDAAALSLADIGIAMGSIGSDVAIESADIVLMRDDFSKVPEMVKLSNFVMGIARENFIIWGTVNALGFILVFVGVLNPAGAAAYNFITDFIPIINSARVFQFGFRK